MTTITIPRTTAKKSDLVAVPKDEYKAFIAWLKLMKSKETFEPSASDKKALKKARKNLSTGRSLTIADLERELGTTR